jgi:hypothetical protein
MPLEAFYGTLEAPLTRSEIAFARRICQACPVLRDCAIVAFQDMEPHGMWAGATPNERKEILRQHSGDVGQSARDLVNKTLYLDCDETA